MALQLEWAFQNCVKSTAFRDALVRQMYGNGSMDDAEDDHEEGSDNDSSERSYSHNMNSASATASAKSLARLFHSRRGIKARLQVLHILLCYAKPYKDLPLQIFFFQQQHAQIFRELLEKDYEMTCEDMVGQNHSTQIGSGNIQENCPMGLPSHMKLRVVSELNELPFWGLLKKVPTLSPYGTPNNNDDHDDDDNGDFSDHYYNNVDNAKTKESITTKEKRGPKAKRSVTSSTKKKTARKAKKSKKNEQIITNTEKLQGKSQKTGGLNDTCKVNTSIYPATSSSNKDLPLTKGGAKDCNTDKGLDKFSSWKENERPFTFEPSSNSQAPQHQRVSTARTSSKHTEKKSTKERPQRMRRIGEITHERDDGHNNTVAPEVIDLLDSDSNSDKDNNSSGNSGGSLINSVKLNGDDNIDNANMVKKHKNARKGLTYRESSSTAYASTAADDCCCNDVGVARRRKKESNSNPLSLPDQKLAPSSQNDTRSSLLVDTIVIDVDALGSKESNDPTIAGSIPYNEDKFDGSSLKSPSPSSPLIQEEKNLSHPSPLSQLEQDDLSNHDSNDEVLTLSNMMDCASLDYDYGNTDGDHTDNNTSSSNDMPQVTDEVNGIQNNTTTSSFVRKYGQSGSNHLNRFNGDSGSLGLDDEGWSNSDIKSPIANRFWQEGKDSESNLLTPRRYSYQSYLSDSSDTV